MDGMEKELRNHLFILVLCGGGGTRLWPRSRKKTPKQFIDLLGEKSIFTQTIERAKRLTSEERIFVITNADYVDEVYEQGKIPLRNIIAESQKKDTALAMAVGAAVIEKIDPEAVIINLASDHLISPEEKFVRDMTVAAMVAREGTYLVSVGIKPASPHTGFGYIQTGNKLLKVNKKQVFKVKAFKEKPNLATAKKFVKSGKYFWNANLYTWKTTTFLAACATYAPRIFKGAKEIQKAWGTGEEQQVVDRVYSRTGGISVDYAISEKAKNMVLIPASFDWSDVGDWRVVWETMPKDKNGNVVVNFGEKGGFYGVESENNLIQFSDRLIALVGVEEMIVIDTPDALLVCPKNKAEKVKEMVNLFKEKSEKEYL